MVRVTAIISAYFAEDFIERRLDNLQGQECRILGCAQKDHAEARVLLDRGIDTILTDGIPTIYDAWNMMIEKVETPYITNANTDDYIYKNGYKLMADALDNHPKFAVAYPNLDIDTKGHVETLETKEGDFEFLMSNCFIGPMPMWRKSLHDKYGLFNEKLHVAGDYDFWLRIAAQGERFFHVRGEPLGKYVNRSDSAEHREALRSIWETAKVRSPYIRRL
jgi:hypothetical protein